MADFFQQYFIDPLIQGTGYNVYNTLVYALLLIAAVFVTYKLLKKMKITIDNKFLLGVLPYVILGGLLRTLEDATSYGIWLKTPIIYFVIFAIAFVGLLISKIIEIIGKRSEHAVDYHMVWATIGFLLVIAGLSQVAFRVPFAFAAIVTLSIFWAIVLIFLRVLVKKFRPNFPLFSLENTALLGVHMFDATTTFVALQYFPYFEQHVLPGFLISLFGPAVMFALKFFVVGVVLYVLDKELKEKKDLEKRKFIKLVIMILGLAPGLRNFFRLVMGV